MNNILYMNVDVDYNATKCIINNSNINLTPLSNIEHYGNEKKLGFETIWKSQMRCHSALNQEL
jgi:hypothetical protein